jgi:hypothetical protein
MRSWSFHTKTTEVLLRLVLRRGLSQGTLEYRQRVFKQNPRHSSRLVADMEHSPRSAFARLAALGRHFLKA